MTQTRIRYASPLGPYYIARKGTDAEFLGEGFHWTHEPREAHAFASQADAQDMIAKHLHALPSHATCLAFESVA